MQEFLPRTYSLKIFYKDNSGGIKESRRLILRKNQFETTLHIILKVLAYLYFWDNELIIEPNFRLRKYRPDLIAWKKEEIPSKDLLIPALWVECKKVKIKKLIKIARVLPSSSIIWIHVLNHLTKVNMSLQDKQKYKLPFNVKLIGINASTYTWECFFDSISSKHPYWRIIRQDTNSLKIFIRDLNLPPGDLYVQFVEFS
ncbi:MAG: hypothetical protein ACFE95_04815 [Candidatus Hodarchaeota archaeon]